MSTLRPQVVPRRCCTERTSSAAGALWTACGWPDQRPLDGTSGQVLTQSVDTESMQSLPRPDGRAAPSWAPRVVVPDDLAARTASAPNVTTLADEVVDWIREDERLLPSIFFEVAGRLRRVAVRGYWQILEGFSLDRGVVAEAFRSGEPQLVPDVSRDPRYLAAIPEVEAELCLPLRHAGCVIGILNVEATTPFAETDLAAVFAAASAFESRLVELGGPEPESAWQRLARRSGELAELDDPDRIGSFAVTSAAEIVGFDSAMLVIERHGVLQVHAACGPRAEQLRSLPIVVLAELATWTGSASCAYTLGTARGEGFEGHRELRRLGVNSFASASLHSNGRRHGYLLVAESEVVDLEVAAVQRLEVLATHTASALDTAFALDELRIRAEQDPLTGLGHGRAFHTHLARVLEGADQPVAILLLDLDNFKHINDTAGHLVGDRVLCETARLLHEVLRTDDLLFRIGGDEFAVVARVRHSDEALQIAHRITEAARQRARTQVSIGVVVAQPGAGDGTDTLFGFADLALYEAKRQGRNRVARYRSELRQAALEEAQLRSDLPTGLAEGQFHLEYQPIIDLGVAGVLGVEALVRWHHPVHGTVSPSRFIPLAEQADQIERIGAWVLDEACRVFASWQHCGVGRADLRLGVNVSAAELAPRLVERVAATLERHRVAPDRLVVEVTEGVFADDRHAVAPLQALRDIGVSVAIDDFGTGYSSLSYLHRLPVNVVKIDRTFVSRLEDPAVGAVTRAIIELGRTLGLSVIAEGVETEAQLAELRSQGCEHAQGYLWSRPVPAARLPSTISRLTRELAGADRAAS